jgi:hypothetical protein
MRIAKTPREDNVDAVKAVIVLTAVVCTAVVTVGALIWFGSATTDFRYLSCMSCHM